jgi:LacI family transcriptional regulator
VSARRRRGGPLPRPAAGSSGYRDALEHAGIAFDPDLVVAGDFTEAGGLMAVNKLLDRGVPFTAVMASNDQAAIDVLLGLHRRGLRVPDDVSVVGFDDLAPARFSIPPLTTVRQSVYETGAIAARCILEILQGRRPCPVLPAPTLEPRESTRRHRR